MMKRFIKQSMIALIILMLFIACSKKSDAENEDGQAEPETSEVENDKEATDNEPTEKEPRELTDEQIETKIDDAIEFTSLEYGFKVTFPLTWEDRYEVKASNWEKDTLKTYDFVFKNDDEEVGTLFSIVVTDMTELNFNEHYGDSFVKLIASNDEYTIGYNIPREPPEELIGDDAIEHLFWEFSRMVNWDVPIIMDTFEWTDKDNVL